MTMAPHVEVTVADEIDRCFRAHAPSPTLRVTEEVSALADRLGLPRPVVSISCSADAPRAVWIRADGVPIPPSLALLRRTWFDVSPSPDLRDLPLRHHGTTADEPETWLLRLATDPSRADVVQTYVARLVAATLALHPSPLLTESYANVYTGFDPRAADAAVGAHAVLAQLLELGCSLKDDETIARFLHHGLAAGWGTEAITEELFLRLRSAELEILVHPSTLGGWNTPRVVSIDHEDLPADIHRFGQAMRRFLRDLGISRPVVITPDQALPDDVVHARINDRTGPPIPLARPGEVVVQASPRALAREGFRGRALVDSSSGHRVLALPEAEAPRLRARGNVPLSAGAFMVVAVTREVTVLADRLLDIDDVERDISRLERSHRPLVRAALSRFSEHRITQVCRGLLREQVSGRDLWTVLNLMLRYHSVDLPPPGHDVVGNAVPTEKGADGLDDVPISSLIAFVRRHTRERVAYDAGLRGAPLGASELPLCDIDEGVELLLRQRLEDGAVDARADEALRFAVGARAAGDRCPGRRAYRGSSAGSEGASRPSRARVSLHSRAREE
jgi:hypothetical protein